jgi:hypothetical protein
VKDYTAFTFKPKQHYLYNMNDMNFCPSTALAANNTFLTPTGPTYSRIVAFAKPTHSRMGRFPSTHLTECCLSISVGRDLQG